MTGKINDFRQKDIFQGWSWSEVTHTSVKFTKTKARRVHFII